jgi:homoserine dehydrogenase
VAESKRPVRLALLGCGTVGGGVLRLLAENGARLAAVIGAPLEVAHVLVRDLEKQRAAECRSEWLTATPERVFGDPELDIVVEVMGGETPAKDYVERALDAHKEVVTANKLLIAKYGPELIERAIERRVDLAFEASVGGGVPVIRTMREALASDTVNGLSAILNGTCNYILTRMRTAGLGFAEALHEAQELGYAEADPTLDVDGHDAAQKLVVTAMLAFGARLDAREVSVEGIRAIDEVDFRFADRFGFTIKHLAIGRDLGGKVMLRVHPTLVPKTSVLANIDGVLNGVYIDGRALGPCLLVGPGAGAMPTAVSVVADIVDVARSRLEGEAGLTTRSIRLTRRPITPMSEVESRYYLRFEVGDSPGVLGVLASELGKEDVSIEQMVQEGQARGGEDGVPVFIITHRAREGNLRRSLEAISSRGFMRRPPRLIRIEDV